MTFIRDLQHKGRALFQEAALKVGGEIRESIYPDNLLGLSGPGLLSKFPSNSDLVRRWRRYLMA